MKKRFSLFIALISLLLLSCFAFAAFGAFAETDGEQETETQVEFSKEITAITPKNGETVSLVNKYIETLFDRFNGEYSSVSKLLNITDEMATFTDALRDEDAVRAQDAVRALYNKFDDFKPVNNVLKWDYAGDAESYTVVVSTKADLSTYIYKGDTADAELLLDNILYPEENYFWQVSANLAGGESVVSDIFAFTTKDTIRTIDIDGVSNTRDIGGFDTPYGKTLNGLVYRCARIDDITEKGIAQMDALKIKSDVDLRNLNEGKRNPSERENDYAYLCAPMYLSVFDVSVKENVKNVVSLFADPDNYPIIFHCSVGRDRTGSLSFILNNLLGVSQEEIICEYLTSFFSVTGSLSVSKEESELLEAIKAMYIILDGYAGENYAEKTASFLISCGITEVEIDAIRDIFTGKIAIENPRQETENADYQNKFIVSFRCFGKAERFVAVDSGAVVAAPYDLENGYVWTVNGSVADFSQPITADTDFVAEKVEGFTVSFIVGGEKTEAFYITGATVDLSQFEKADYYTFFVNQAGDLLDALVVNGDTTISVIYIKK